MATGSASCSETRKEFSRVRKSSHLKGKVLALINKIDPSVDSTAWRQYGTTSGYGNTDLPRSEAVGQVLASCSSFILALIELGSVLEGG